VWDLSHNALGRAFIFYEILNIQYDVTIIGPLIEDNGTEVWYPLKGEIKCHILKSQRLPDLYFEVHGLLLNNPPDFVIASKARIHSMLPALLIKEKFGIPIFLDIDDNELSFFESVKPVSLDDIKSAISNEDFINPHNRYWTVYATSLIESFDAVFTSTKAIGNLYGGNVIGHARDESLFVSDESIRLKKREELGYNETDRIILFAGTPRRHKGLIEIAKALKKINLLHYHFLIVGTFLDDSLKEELIAIDYQNIRFFEDQKFKDLPKFLNLADLICLIQDTDSKVSQYQIPAKVTDAFSSGTVLLTSNVPPIQELIQEGFKINTIETEVDLEFKIPHIFENLNLYKHQVEENYVLFKKKLSYGSTLKKITTLFEKNHDNKSIKHSGTEFLSFLKLIFENRNDKDSLNIEQPYSELIKSKYKKEIDWYKATYLHLPKWYVKIGGIFRKFKRQ
jgi:glycosyltransferase involved in cell wall biosynthesis